MAADKNNNNNQNDKRSRLIHPVALLVITAVLVLALVLLFPARRFAVLTHSPPDTEETSSISIIYLQALLRANPDDRELRISLARRQARAGQPTEANATLAPLEDSNENEVQWLLLELAWQAFNAVSPDDPERDARRAVLVERMQNMQDRPELVPDRLQTLATRFLALGAPGRAARLYERVAGQVPAQAYQWHALAGRWWLAADEPGRAARAWEHAFARADAPSQRREAALATLDAIRLNDDASGLDRVSRFIQAFPDDPTFLDIGVDMALASNRLGRARRWSREYIAQRPDDNEAQQRDAQIALAVNDTEAALSGLQRLVADNPDNTRLRAQLAQVQIWAGRPEAALANYERLARAADDDSRDLQVIELAQDMSATGALIMALNRIRQRHPLDDGQRRLLLDALDRLGRPERAIAVLQDWFRSGDMDRALWVRLATLQEFSGDLTGARDTWKRIAARFGRALDETRARARLLTRDWRQHDALAVMRSLPDTAGADREARIAYWNTLGELAWNLDASAAARDAYRALYMMGELEPNGYLRLVQTAVATGRTELAMRVTRRDWRQNRHADAVIQMLAAAQRQRRPDLTRELLAMAASRPALFADSTDYWQLYAEYHFQQRDLDKARMGYLRALAIAPGHAGNRAALLYTLAESGRTSQLRRYADAWREEARHDPRQWQVFAMAYSCLGENRRALPWFDRAIRHDPDNYLLALDYADALERARRFDSARRMREYALAELRPRLMRELNGQGLLTARQRRAHQRVLGVQAAMLGPDASRAWLRHALQGRRGHALNPVDIEMLFGYYLSRQQPAYARYWLLAAQRRRMATEAWRRLAVALQQNNQVAMQRILQAAGPEGAGDIGIADRIDARRQLGYRERALTLALSHTRLDASYAAGGDAVPRYAAELYGEMPQNYGVRVGLRRISDLDITSERVFFTLSNGRLSTRVQLGARQLSDTGIDLTGLDHERFAEATLNWRQRRGVSTFRIGTVSADATDLLQLGLRQDWQVTDRINAAVFADYNALAADTGELRVLGVRDGIGAAIGGRLTARDSVSLTGTFSRFYSRANRNRLGEGYSLEAVAAHSLMAGPTYRLQVRGFAATEQNSLVDDLPGDVAARLPEGRDPGDVLPERFSFIGVGVSLARGAPGADFPVVASPRYRLDLDAGYTLPDRQFGISANLAVGSRVLGSDELSLNLGFDQTGSDTRQNSYTGAIQYRYFLGR